MRLKIYLSVRSSKVFVNDLSKKIRTIKFIF